MRGVIINSLCTKIAKKLVIMDIVEFDDYEICIYGLEMFLSNLIELAGIIIIGYFLNCLLETVVFIISFSTLRVNAGGYHAKTCLNCFIFICFLTFGTIFMLDKLTFLNSIYIILSILTIAFIIILKYAPVDTINKPLCEDEKKKYRKRSIYVFFIVNLVILGAYFINKNLINYCTISAFSIGLESVTLLKKGDKRRG